ncbi:hypothetical protein BD324DRAFT_639000 [Kockovaella imperatae]|uniref:Uncharacterized protein n=1 Tax=Kockovaella imperatae TaxID=4999 RepID=A0A1Y1U6H5_9TREE|nr:hypothetical protein BD324DRAFT_639000 [Kockovaella imperatae]ORX33643.1 hypothetical protein BD324DRAFT_639000 [Kockovaella imperatae]
MVKMSALPRQCLASSSRYTLNHPIHMAYRSFSFFPHRTPPPPPLPFFSPPSLQPFAPGGSPEPSKDKTPREEEVDDHEWEIRAAKATLHLQDSIPRFFQPEQTTSDMFPADIFSANLILKLPPPLPLKTSSLTAYSLVSTLARSGMQALHSDLRISLDRMTYNSPTSVALPNLNAKRQRQIRSLVTVRGKPRLPGGMEAVWHTSSLYTLSPYSGLIISHEVESIRPLPGEGVAEWLRNRLRGWRKEEDALPVPCPRAVPVPSTLEILRFLERQRKL